MGTESQLDADRGIQRHQHGGAGERQVVVRSGGTKATERAAGVRHAARISDKKAPTTGSIDRGAGSAVCICPWCRVHTAAKVQIQLYEDRIGARARNGTRHQGSR